jgi:uncharacterized protein YuzE
MAKAVKYSYDPSSDELNIDLGQTREAILAEVQDEVYVKLDPKSKQVIGITILHLGARFQKRKRGRTFSLPLLGTFILPAPLRKKLLAAS